MTDQDTRPFTLYCSFCGGWHKDLDFLIVGPEVSICSNCVESCNVYIAERKLLSKKKLTKEIKQIVKKEMD